MAATARSAASWQPTSFQLFNLAFGVAIGVGWIVVVGSWLNDAGPLGTAAAFAATGAAMLSVGLCYARVASQLPGYGGEVQYAASLFGDRAAFFLGWFLALAYVAVLAFELVALAWIARSLWPALEGAGSVLAFGPSQALIDFTLSVLILAGVVGANMIGPRTAARLQDALVVAKVVGSCALVAAGIAYGRAEYLRPLWSGESGQSPVSGFFSVLATAPFFFAGFGAIAQAVPDIDADLAKRRLPAIMCAVIGATALFYILIVLVVAAAAPRSAVVGASLPAAQAFELATGSAAAGKLVLVIGFLGLITILNGVFFSTVRLIQRIGTLDRGSSVLPRASLVGVFVAGVALALSLLGQAMIESFLALSSAAISGVMTVVCVCALLLSVRSGLLANLVPLAGVACAMAMTVLSAYGAIIAAPRDAIPPWLIAASWTLLGLLYWSLVKRSRSWRAL